MSVPQELSKASDKEYRTFTAIPYNKPSLWFNNWSSRPEVITLYPTETSPEDINEVETANIVSDASEFQTEGE